MAESQLAAHLTDNVNRVRLEGPPVTLKADLATPFGLVLHELATNAAKYGSLSVSGGRVSVSWKVDHDSKPTFRMLWEEQNGPQVIPPAKTSFGTSLVERGIPDATIKREFRTTGFVCSIEVPLDQLSGDGGGSNRGQPNL